MRTKRNSRATCTAFVMLMFFIQGTIITSLRMCPGFSVMTTKRSFSRKSLASRTELCGVSLLLSAGKELEEEIDRECEKMEKFQAPTKSTGRAGGRKPFREFRRQTKDQGEKRSPLGYLRSIIVPLLIAAFAIQALVNLFAGGGNDSFVYYQSTVYESKVIGADGQMQTSRKESFRSNIPGLIENQKDLQRSNADQREASDERSFLLDKKQAAAEFDKVLDMQMRTIFDDFF